jgi:glycerol kinase
MVGDQQGALYGQACRTPGLAKNTYGTGCFLLMHTGDRPLPSAAGLLTTAAARLEGETPQFALEGSVFMGGAVVQWLRDGLGLIRESQEVQALAAQVPDSEGVVLVPAFTGLGAPYWQPDARGALVGLTRGTRAAHIARAALEAIAFQSAAVLTAMNRDACDHATAPLQELRVDGGASTNDLLMQMQADVLGLPVVRPQVTETTALGAAALAGLQAGVWANGDGRAEGAHAARVPWRVQQVFQPQRSPAWAAERMSAWAHAVRQAVAK